MTRRQIGAHLVALLLLFVLVLSAWLWLHSRFAVPGLLTDLAGSDSPTRVRALARLGRLGPAALPASDIVAVLATGGRTQQERSSAVAALREISLQATLPLVATYRARLRDPRPRERYEAAMLLAELGPLAEPAAPELRTASGDANALVRRWAVSALGAAALADTANQDVILQALDDPDQGVRYAALLTLSNGLVPRTVLQRGATQLRWAQRTPGLEGIATMALRDLDDAQPLSIELASARLMLERGGGAGTRYALQKLARLGPDAAPAQAAVSALLDAADAQTRHLAVLTLRAIGAPTAAVYSALAATASADADALVRETARATLGTLTEVQAAPPRADAHP